MPSHANRAAAARQHASNAPRRGGGYGRGARATNHGDHSLHSMPVDGSSVDVFGGVMGDEDADDAEAALEAFDLADIAATSGANFDFSHLGTSIAAGGLSGSGGVHGTLSGVPMNNLAGFSTNGGGSALMLRGGHVSGGLTGGSRRSGHGLGLGSDSPIAVPHGLAFQIHAGGVNARKRQRDDDSLGGAALAAAGLTTGGLTQGVLMVGTNDSDDGNEHGGFGGLSGFLAGSSLDGNSLGNGSDDGHGGQSGSVGRGSSASREGEEGAGPDWFSM